MKSLLMLITLTLIPLVSAQPAYSAEQKAQTYCMVNMYFAAGRPYKQLFKGTVDFSKLKPGNESMELFRSAKNSYVVSHITDSNEDSLVLSINRVSDGRDIATAQTLWNAGWKGVATVEAKSGVAEPGAIQTEFNCTSYCTEFNGDTCSITGD